MKKFFSLASLLLAASILFTACGGNTTEGGEQNTPLEPLFPTAVTATVAPASEYTLTIEPNLAWEVSVPESTAAYFHIKSGDNAVY